MHLAGLVTLIAFALSLEAFFPFGRLKSFANALMPDDNIKSLKESNLLVFRILMGEIGLILLALAFGIGAGRVKNTRIWFGRLFTAN
jgi:hypothetical protein